MKQQPTKKRFDVGAHVRVIMPGVNGVVTHVEDELGPLAQYWHTLETKHGKRKEPGSNLELIPQPIGGEMDKSSAAALRVKLVEYFHSLELALDEHKQKGTPDGDAVYQEIFDQLAGDLAMMGVGKDQLEEVASACGHGTTLARLEKLLKKPIGFGR